MKTSHGLNLIFTRLRTFFHGFFFEYIFLKTFNPVILFPETLLAASYFSYFRKKNVPGILTSGLYFQWHFGQGLENWDFFTNIFISRFFPETFFPLSFLNRFLNVYVFREILGKIFWQNQRNWYYQGKFLQERPYRVVYKFLGLQSITWTTLRLFTFLPETAVHLVCLHSSQKLRYS